MSDDLHRYARGKLLKHLAEQRPRRQPANDNDVATRRPVARRSCLSVQARDRLMRAGSLLHDCGARSVAEFIAEIAERDGDASFLLDRLDAFTRLPPGLYAQVGADRPPPPPIGEAPK